MQFLSRCSDPEALPRALRYSLSTPVWCGRQGRLAASPPAAWTRRCLSCLRGLGVRLVCAAASHRIPPDSGSKRLTQQSESAGSPHESPASRILETGATTIPISDTAPACSLTRQVQPPVRGSSTNESSRAGSPGAAAPRAEPSKARVTAKRRTNFIAPLPSLRFRMRRTTFTVPSRNTERLHPGV